MEVTINLNEHILVKLTKYAKDIIDKKNKLSKYPIVIEEDKDGYSKWQLWDFMNEFGSFMVHGNENIVENNIITLKKEV
jgi:hypothetical protein